MVLDSDEFLRNNYFGVLATIKRDGSPQLTPVAYRCGHRQLPATPLAHAPGR